MNRRNPVPRATASLACLTCLICFAWLSLARPTVAQGALGEAIVEEDLGFELEALLTRAEEVFHSADQPSSIPLFSEAVLLIEGQLASGGDSTELKDLLIRSLFFRAEAKFNLGEREAAQQDLERILRLRPGFEVDPTLVSRKLREAMEGLRKTLVGEVDLVLDPADAWVEVDGERLETGAYALALLAGPHTLSITRPGYEGQSVEMDLPAGKVQLHEATLERTSAVVRLMVRPAGATVLVDGQPASAEESAPGGGMAHPGAADMTIWDLAPGSREIEIRKEGFRPSLLKVDVAELVDYELPPVGLDPTQGTVLLVGAPTGARLLVNGEPRDRPSSATGEWELLLPPGDHTIRVTAGPLGEFERAVTLADRQTVELGVELQPSLVFLGVLGGDRTAARAVSVRITRVMADLNNWALLDRSAGGANVLLDNGVDTPRLRRLATGRVAVSEDPDWSGLRAALDRELQGSLYMLGVLTDDLFATHADLWLWAAEPGPARPRRVRVPLDGAAELSLLAARLEAPITLSVPWVGARFADSAASVGPLVISVTPDGPAAQAGLVPGDTIRSLDGEPVEDAHEVRLRIAESRGAELAFEAGFPGAYRTVSIAPGSSPHTFSLTDPDLLDPAVAAVLSREASRTDGAPPAWLLELNRALLHMRAGEWVQAVRVLREVEAPDGPGLGQAAVSYWLGVALLEADRNSYEATARGLFARAAAMEGARLRYHDGPLVQTRARARVESQSP